MCIFRLHLFKLVILLFIIHPIKSLGYTYEELLELVNYSQNIDEVLKNLPDQLKENIVIGFSSDAEKVVKEYVSPKNPRIIMYTDDGRLLLSVVSDPASPLYNSLQVIRVTQEETWIPENITIRKGVSKITRPRKCLTCHHKGRPNWDTYNRWRNFWGSYHKPVGDEAYKHLSEEEVTAYKEASQVYDDNPRLADLKPEKLKSYNELSIRTLLDRNLKATQVMHKANLAIIFNEIKNSPNFNKFQLAIFYATRNAAVIDGKKFINLISKHYKMPKEVVKNLYNKSLETVIKDSTEYAQRRFEVGQRLFNYQRMHFMEKFNAKYPDTLAMLRVVFKDLMGLDWDLWTLPLEKGSNSWIDGELNHFEFYRLISNNVIFNSSSFLGPKSQEYLDFEQKLLRLLAEANMKINLKNDSCLKHSQNFKAPLGKI